ncbi:MAG: response regulator [Sulfitobacter sp.]
MSDSLRLLHVDDDPDIQEVAKMALEVIGGFTVHQCPSGAEALKDAEVFKPDIFLLDVMMPEMSGEQLFAKLRDIPALANVPAIFMTARVQKSEVVALKKLGAIEVIEKPFDAMTLSDQIRTAMGN